MWLICWQHTKIVIIQSRVRIRAALSGGKKQVVEGDTARGTAALVYLQLHISLYTGTVHVLSSVAEVHPTSLTVD